MIRHTVFMQFEHNITKRSLISSAISW